MPEFKIPPRHKQGNKSSFVVRKGEIEAAEMIGYDLAILWIASRDRWVGPMHTKEKDIEASRELRDRLASLPIEKSKNLVEGRLENAPGSENEKIPGGIWALVAVADDEEVNDRYEWRVEGLGGGDWTAILANRRDLSKVYVGLRISSEFLLRWWPSRAKPKDNHKQSVPDREVIDAIKAIHHSLREHHPELIPLTLEEAEEFLVWWFPKAGKRRLRDIFQNHSEERARRGRGRISDQRKQRLKEFREILTAAKLKP